MARTSKKTTQRRNARVRVGIWLGAFVVIAAAVLALAWVAIVFPHLRGRGQGRVVAVHLSEHATVEDASHELRSKGLIRNPTVFTLFLRLSLMRGHFRSGRILVTDDMTARELLFRMTEGLGHAEVRVSFPPGFNRFDIASRLEDWNICGRDAFLAATLDPTLLTNLGVDGTSAEGFLYPDTYRFLDDTPPSAIVRRMVENGREKRERLFVERAPFVERMRTELGLSRKDLVALASVVEKEAVRDFERPIIAGVFLNRLRDPDFRPRARLQADPTVVYGCLDNPSGSEACQNYNGHISRAMLDDRSNRYNTYHHGGVTPTAICNPSDASLAAVLHPAEHNYYFFVAKGQGQHTFSHSLGDHARAVDTYRDNSARSRQGR